MYEIIMTSGDRAECETIAACLVTAATLAEDSGWGATVRSVDAHDHPHVADSGLRHVLNAHLAEVRP